MWGSILYVTSNLDIASASIELEELKCVVIGLLFFAVDRNRWNVAHEIHILIYVRR